MTVFFKMAAGFVSAAILLSGSAIAADTAPKQDTAPQQKTAPTQKKDGIASADQARQVLSYFAQYDAEMAYCGKKTGDPDTFSAAHQEWLRRNLYLREQAYNVLSFRKTDADEGAIAQKAQDEIAGTYAEVKDVTTACQATVDKIWAGDADISVLDPSLVDLMYKSTEALDNRHPDSVGAPG